jgi:hypothetical protein
MDGKIFNLYQANLFIKKGCEVECVGISKGSYYVQFKANELFHTILKQWNMKNLNE